MKLTINVDGGSRGNPGPAAYGCYVQGAGPIPIRLKGRLGNTTNNVAEYHGLIRALEKAIELGADEVQILADSELMVRQMTGVYRVKNDKIIPLHQAATELARQLGKVRYQHVYREQNSQADALCNEALDDPRMPDEPLGLLHAKAAPSRIQAVPASAQKPTTKSTSEYAKVKLQGSLISLLSLKKTKSWAVVVNGVSWNLSLARVTASMKPGDQVTVLGELVMHQSQPVVRVKSIKKTETEE